MTFRSDENFLINVFPIIGEARGRRSNTMATAVSTEYPPYLAACVRSFVSLRRWIFIIEFMCFLQFCASSSCCWNKEDENWKKWNGKTFSVRLAVLRAARYFPVASIRFVLYAITATVTMSVFRMRFSPNSCVRAIPSRSECACVCESAPPFACIRSL